MAELWDSEVTKLSCLLNIDLCLCDRFSEIFVAHSLAPRTEVVWKALSV